MLSKLKQHTTFVSEVLASAAIIASAATYVYQTLYKPHTLDVQIQVASSTARVLSFLVTNDGGRDVVITSGLVKSSIGHGAISTKLLIKEEGELVKKGETLLLSPAPSNLSGTVHASTKGGRGISTSTNDCSAEIDFVDSKGDHQVKEVKFKCHAATFLDPRNLPESTNLRRSEAATAGRIAQDFADAPHFEKMEP